MPRPAITSASPVPSTAGTVSNFLPSMLWNSMGRCAQLVPQSYLSASGIDVAVGHQQILPAVVVVVEKRVAPTEEGNRISAMPIW